MRQEDQVEERYRKYQGERNRLEQQREDYERKRRRYEEVRENRRRRLKEDRDRVQELLAVWEDSGESHPLIGLLEERMQQERQEEQQQELELSEELAVIRESQSRCEESYQRDVTRLREEQGQWEADRE